MLVADIVTVAEYVPTASPSFAFTVKVVFGVPSFKVVTMGCVMVKLPGFAPLNAVTRLARSPVPVLVIVNVFVS
jgi:hypothetical protein